MAGGFEQTKQATPWSATVMLDGDSSGIQTYATFVTGRPNAIAGYQLHHMYHIFFDIIWYIHISSICNIYS